MRTIVLILSLSVNGCATLTVSAHIERTANFADYVTFGWGPADNFPVGDPRLDNNPFFRDYVHGAIEKQLHAKGYVLAVSGEPDLLVHYHASVSRKVDVQGADQPYGNCYGDCTTRVIEFEQGTLVVDIVDAKTSQVIWRGWSQDTVTGVIDNQRRLEQQVATGVVRMMALLPPGGRALP